VSRRQRFEVAGSCVILTELTVLRVSISTETIPSELGGQKFNLRPPPMGKPVERVTVFQAY
jgi:hypothetical protein